MSEKVAKKRKSKWYGMKPEHIRKIWDEENRRSTDLGGWYHDKQERDLWCKPFLQKGDSKLSIYKPQFEEGLKIAPCQQLVDGVYPEFMTYMALRKISGQIDRLEVFDGFANIKDYKTNKSIDTEGYVNWQGKSKRMLAPLSHLDDCNFVHYSLQLSLYMYMILLHNPHLKPGLMEIDHVRFAQEGQTEHGFPITATDTMGDPIIEALDNYEIPYLADEVYQIMLYLKKHPEVYQ